MIEIGSEENSHNAKISIFIQSFCLPQQEPNIFDVHKFELMAVIVLTFLKVVLEMLLNCVK